MDIIASLIVSVFILFFLVTIDKIKKQSKKIIIYIIITSAMSGIVFELLIYFFGA